MQNRCKKKKLTPPSPDLPPTRMKNTTTRKKKTWLPRGEANEPKPHATRILEPPRNIHRETEDDDPQTKIAQSRKTTRMQRKNEGSKTRTRSTQGFFCSLRRKERARTESRGIESHQRHAPICISFIHIHISSFSSTIIQPVIFSVNGNREHTPEVIRPVLKAGNHGSEKPKEPVQI
jgi:hypothetical protein